MRKNVKNSTLNAFTLMELMIVIVIIGILSAVGMVMFGGQTEKAQQASTKSIQKQMVTYISVEMMNCSMGETKTMSDNLTCSGRTAASVVAAAVNAQKDEHKNPFQTEVSAITSGGNNTADTDAGFIRLSVSGTNIIVKSCNKKPCSTAGNKEEKSIAFQ